MKVLGVTALVALFATASAVDMNTNGQYLKLLKLKQWAETRRFDEATRSRFPSVVNQAATCNSATNTLKINGEDFPCNNIDFEGFVSLDNMMIDSNTNAGSDIWGWLDPNGREITIMCVNNGVWFVDGTTPSNPKILGSMAAKSSRGSSWCDVKVYKDVAYIVKDAATPDNGIQVFDLNRLNDLEGVAPEDFESATKFTEDFHYDIIGDVHNVAVDTESGYLFCVGSRLSCNGGLHIINLEPNPLEPQFESCFGVDGYTHDAQCVVYDGPHTKYVGREICFNFNEDTLTIVDITNKQDIIMLARERYDGVAYSHQGWLTEDMRYVLLDDELDEAQGGDKHTKTMIVNVEDLENPVFESRIIHGDNSIDHNLYFWGAIHKKGWGGNPPMENAPLSQYAYLSNYAAGIQVVDMSEIGNGIVKRAGYFDCAPEYDTAEFHGTWSNYMHPSGVLAVSSIERGLFLIRPNMAFAEARSTEVMNVQKFGVVGDTGSTSGSGVNDLTAAVVVLSILVALAVFVVPATVFIYVKKVQSVNKGQADGENKSVELRRSL